MLQIDTQNKYALKESTEKIKLYVDNIENISEGIKIINEINA